MHFCLQFDYKWFIFNLAVWDFLLCLGFLTIQPYYMGYSHLPVTEGCKIWGIVLFGVACCTITGIPLLSFNRYIALYHNAKYSRIFRKRNIVIMVSVAGILGMIW